MVVVAVVPAIGCVCRAAESLQPQEVVLEVGGPMPLAETITLDQYGKLKAFYELPENSVSGEPNDRTYYRLALTSFGPETATVGLVAQHHSKGWQWSRRFILTRDEATDKALGITDLRQARAAVIGGVKRGMKADDVIRLKGLHYKESPHQLVGSADLIYDDVTVSVKDWHLGSGSGVVTAVAPVTAQYIEYAVQLPYEDDVVRVYGKPPVAETISLDEYARVQAFYKLPANRYDPNSRISHFVSLVRFNDRSAIAGVVAQRLMHRQPEWVRRFQFSRDADVDRALGVTRVIEDRSRLIGDIKWGMLAEDVIARKGMHYKDASPNGTQAVTMCYDDVRVEVDGGIVRRVLPGDGNQGEDMRNIPYADEKSDKPGN